MFHMFPWQEALPLQLLAMVVSQTVCIQFQYIQLHKLYRNSVFIFWALYVVFIRNLQNFSCNSQGTDVL